MQGTYDQAIAQILKDEGGYTNESTDPGGPTNWGITIHDAKQYWKPDATAEDVKEMPLGVAKDIYRAHYAVPVSYDSLAAGVDYAVLDFGVNSGVNRAVKTLQGIVGVIQDGVVGPATIAAVNRSDPTTVINNLYDQRLAFLKQLHTWDVYGRGWTNRCTHGRNFALSLVSVHPQTVPKQTWVQLLIDSIFSLFKKGNK